MTRQPIWLAIVVLAAASAAADDGPIPVQGPARQSAASGAIFLRPTENQEGASEGAATAQKTPYDIALETGHADSCDACCGACFLPRVATRFGWWGVSTDGSKQKVGEYQDLDASPF